MPDSLIDAAAFEALAYGGVPYVGQLGFKVERLSFGAIALRLPYQDLLVRPGGTVCGPAMMALADIAAYGVVLSMIGPVELAVTTDLNIHFLKKPKPTGLIAEGTALKHGRRLAVAQVTIHSEADTAPVAFATATYAIPD